MFRYPFIYSVLCSVCLAAVYCQTVRNICTLAGIFYLIFRTAQSAALVCAEWVYRFAAPVKLSD